MIGAVRMQQANRGMVAAHMDGVAGLQGQDRGAVAGDTDVLGIVKNSTDANSLWKSKL